MTQRNTPSPREPDLGQGIEHCSRREFLKLAGLGSGTLAAGSAGTGALLHSEPARAVPTSARIVIVGAGAAGLGCANRLSDRLEGAEITVVDRREPHYYQPALPLVGTGVWSPSKAKDRNARYMPSDVRWVKSMVAEYDPDNNRVVTDEGETLDYDYLIVATGLELRFDQIEGMSPELIGSHGIACVYDTPEHGERSARAVQAFTREGGKGLFIRPPGDIKCAGAPLKVAMITEYLLRQNGTREQSELHYYPPDSSMFTQPDLDTFLKAYFPEQRGIDIHYHHRVKGVDAEAQRVTFESDEHGEYTESYDLLHIPPPMSAPQPVRESALAWAEGETDAGWLEVDPYSLRHRRYPNVFGAGDVCGVPISKTSASAKSMIPVVVDNLVDAIAEREPSAAYSGYTSCPLITEVGEAMLVEFNYELEMVPSFPFIDPLKPQWAAWVMERWLLHPTYNAMLRGRIS